MALPEDSPRDGRRLVREGVSERREIYSVSRPQRNCTVRAGQSLAQMAIAWVLRDKAGFTSALIGARNVDQLDNSLDALQHLHSQRRS